MEDVCRLIAHHGLHAVHERLCLPKVVALKNGIIARPSAEETLNGTKAGQLLIVSEQPSAPDSSHSMCSLAAAG